MLIAMTILRDGYWNGQYPRAGDTILVEAGYVESLEVAGFAMRAPDLAKEKPHGKNSAHTKGR